MEEYCGPLVGAPWDASRWPNFAVSEIACSCCGEVYIWPEPLDALRRLCNLIGGPLTITSGHRCARHNSDPKTGGKNHSVHLQLAFDLALKTYPRSRMLALARAAGFKRFGLMLTGLHVDTHPLDAQHAEMWTYGPKSRTAWNGLFPVGTIDIGGA